MFKIFSLGSSVPLILLVPLAYFLFHWCWHQWGVQHPPTRWPAHHCWQDSVPIKTSLEIMVNLQNVILILIWMQTFFRRASANSCSGTSHCDLNCISFKFRQNIFGLKCLVNIALFTWCLHMDVHCQFLLHFQEVVWVCNDNDIQNNHNHHHFLFPDHLITLDSRWKKLSLFPPPIAGLSPFVPMKTTSWSKKLRPLFYTKEAIIDCQEKYHGIWFVANLKQCIFLTKLSVQQVPTINHLSNSSTNIFDPLVWPVYHHDRL